MEVLLARPQGTWMDMEAVCSLERETGQTESRAERRAARFLAFTASPTSMPHRHDFIFLVNSIFFPPFFSKEKKIRIKRRDSELPKCPSKG